MLDSDVRPVPEEWLLLLCQHMEAGTLKKRPQYVSQPIVAHVLFPRQTWKWFPSGSVRARHREHHVEAPVSGKPKRILTASCMSTLLRESSSSVGTTVRNAPADLPAQHWMRVCP